MTKKDSFDKDFDFEKEYGFDPNTILDPEFESDEAMQTSFDASFDQTFIKEFAIKGRKLSLHTTVKDGDIKEDQTKFKLKDYIEANFGK